MHLNDGNCRNILFILINLPLNELLTTYLDEITQKVTNNDDHFKNNIFKGSGRLRLLLH